jgi:hypothetical protein
MGKMINTGKASNVLERTETRTEMDSKYERAYNRSAGSLSGDYSVSNDLMRNYA